MEPGWRLPHAPVWILWNDALMLRCSYVKGAHDGHPR
jgi:hypothetical protein